MKKYILGVIILLISIIGFTQEAKEKKIKSSKYFKILSGQQINLLHQGALFVRLKTRTKSIEALRKYGNDKKADKIESQQEKLDKRIIKAFRENFDFCPVYFFFSDYSQSVKNKQLDKVEFLNDSLIYDSTIKYDNLNFFIAEFGLIEQDTTKYINGNDYVQTENGLERRIQYYGDQNMGFSALIIKSDEFVQLKRPFPYYAKAFDVSPFKRKTEKVVSMMNYYLHEFYDKHNKLEQKIRKRNNKSAPPGTVWIRDSLYMDIAEVKNIDYKEYIYRLKQNGSKDSVEYKNALPDTLVWRTPLAYNEPFVELYFQHQAYNNYPLVGISYKQAVDYCKWRTDRVNGVIYKKLHKIEWTRKINTDTIPKYVKYRLPTKEEWDYSARGGLKDASYPWGGYFLTNYKGENLANYNGIGDEWIAYSDSLKYYVIKPRGAKPFTINDIHGLTSPVNSYPPNGYGIYNISGNVAEMIAEKGIAKGGSYQLPGYHCRIDQDWNYTKPSNHVGFRCACDKLIDW